MRLGSILVALLWALLATAAGTATAASPQPIGSFPGAIYLTSDPGDPERLFVVDQSGRIFQHENGVTSTFANIEALVECCDGERGLLSIALAPDFDRSGRLYVFYVGKEEPGEIQIAELRQVGGVAPIGTLRQVLTIPHPDEENHFGGQLQFGPDGRLYISTGDGGGANDPHRNAQNLGNLLGKILRIDPLPNGVLRYTVPAGNPFVGQAGAKGEIWSYGLRNPFRFSFDRLRGDLTIGDVGQKAKEEIDFAPAPAAGAGLNFGWSCREGLDPGPVVDPDPACAGKDQSEFTDPAFDFPHAAFSPGGIEPCAVIGGYVVRDPSLEGLYGRYLYGDFCSGELRSLDLTATDPFASDRPEDIEVDELDSFGEDSCGRLYTVSRNGQVTRLVGAKPRSCAAPLPPSSSFKPAPQPRSSYVGIQAEGRKVERGRRATVIAWVSPCEGRRGELVRLRKGRQRLGTRYLNRACTVRFRPRIWRKSSFRAEIAANREYVAASSRVLKIRPTPRRHQRNRPQ